jgi:hypothetical protein
MNNRQQYHTFDTKISGQCPWKNPEGKTSQGEILLIELAGKILSLQQQYFSAINTQHLSRKTVLTVHLDFCAKDLQKLTILLP